MLKKGFLKERRNRITPIPFGAFGCAAILLPCMPAASRKGMLRRILLCKHLGNRRFARDRPADGGLRRLVVPVVDLLPVRRIPLDEDRRDD